MQQHQKPLRILQFIGIANGGGVESVIMNYYRHIDRNQVQFDFVFHEDSPYSWDAEIQQLGGRVYKVANYAHNPVKFTYQIYQIVKQHHYDIVHSNMNTISAFPLFAAWLAGAPVRILHNHSTSSPGETKRNIMKAILRPFAKLFANRYFACSQLAADWMYGKRMAHSNKVHIINNAIDLQKFAFDAQKRAYLRHELGLNDEFVIGHVGRFMFQKNHAFLLDVFAKVRAKHSDAVLLLIGDGPLRPAMEQKVCDLRLTNSVKFLGLRHDVQDLYNAMDLFLLPSHYEGLPVVGVEAQANGLPIIVSDKVTSELKMTNVIQYESLAVGADKWVNDVEMCYNKRTNQHADTAAMMRAAGFDIMKAAQTLQAEYMR